MEFEVALTAAATALPPSLAWADFGNEMIDEVPSVQALPAASTRYCEKFCVVPEESERTSRLIAELGRLALGLRALIAGSFQVVILPEKIPARTVASSFRSVTPDTLYAMAIGPICTGKYSTFFLNCDASFDGIGESEPAY